MITILVGNSYSKITGLTAKQFSSLKKKLSYVVGGSSAYFSSYGIRRTSLLSKSGEFPTGLLNRVTNELPSVVIDNRVKPKHRKSIEINGLSTWQAQDDAVSEAMWSNRGIICMPTGTGKSLVIALIVARLNVKTLVVVPSLEIKRQLTASLLGVLKGKCDVTVENIDSKRLQTTTNYDCLIIDEGHHVAAKTYRKLNKTAWNNIYYRFFLTATPFRNDKEEDLLFESIAGSLIYRLDYKTAVSKGYIVPVDSYYVEIPTQSTDAYTWSEVYSKLVVNNKIRNDIIANLLYSLYVSSVSTLCLVKEIAHGKELSRLTGMPFANGEDEESRLYIEKFNRGDIKTLVGTVGILGEGIDTKPCEYVIIAGLGKAKSQFMQAVGRAVRKYKDKESAKVILIKDRSHKFLLRHFQSQVTVLKEEYGSKTIKLEDT
jgi:superfamily II DNA or RNA helicase